MSNLTSVFNLSWNLLLGPIRLSYMFRHMIDFNEFELSCTSEIIHWAAADLHKGYKPIVPPQREWNGWQLYTFESKLKTAKDFWELEERSKVLAKVNWVKSMLRGTWRELSHLAAVQAEQIRVLHPSVPAGLVEHLQLALLEFVVFNSLLQGHGAGDQLNGSVITGTAVQVCSNLGVPDTFTLRNRITYLLLTFSTYNSLLRQCASLASLPSAPSTCLPKFFVTDLELGSLSSLTSQKNLKADIFSSGTRKLHTLLT